MTLAPGAAPGMGLPASGPTASGVTMQGIPQFTQPQAAPQPAGDQGFWPSYFSESVPHNNHWYVTADYLLWRLRNQTLPGTVDVLPTGVLAITSGTTNVGSGAPPSIQVINYVPLTIQSTATFSNGNTLDPGEQSGERVYLGYWFDEDHTFGLEAGGFVIDKRTSTFGSTSQNQPNQFVINTGLTDTINVYVTSSTGPIISNSLTTPIVVVRQTTSTIVGDGTSSLWGLEFNGRCTVLSIGGATFGGVFGVRYVDYSEELDLNTDVTFMRPTNPTLQTPVDVGNPPPIPALLHFTTMDSLRTYNQFYGAQIGADAEFDVGRFYLYARGTIGVGETHQTVDVGSATTNITAGTVSAGGLLTGPFDVGQHTRDRISFEPAATVKLGYAFTRWLKGYVGYDVLYLTHVARPSDVSGTSTIATNVSVAGSTTTVNVSQPAFRWADSSLLAQGLTFGLEFSY